MATVRGSAGVARVSGGEASVEVMLKNADTALYAAKSAGKNRVAVFRPEMLAAAP